MSSLGVNSASPVVQSHRTSQEKAPWKDLSLNGSEPDAHKKGIPLLRRNVEAQFIRPLYLGESIAPFRLLEPVLAIIPWDGAAGGLMDSATARGHGHADLADWLQEAESLWGQHQRGAMTLNQRIDYWGELSAQFPTPALRVVYSKAGALQAAAMLIDHQAIIDHTLYWAAVNSDEEALYLLAVLNSETARAKTEHLQSQGQWGARHFDKVMLSLPIPKYDPANPLHHRLAQAARWAKLAAARVPLDGMHFVAARRRIREMLRKHGMAQHMDEMVAQLLG